MSRRCSTAGPAPTTSIGRHEPLHDRVTYAHQPSQERPMDSSEKPVTTDTATPAPTPAIADPPQDLTPYAKLSPELRQKADLIMASVDVGDPQEVLQFGLPAQDKIASFADTLLADVRNKDTGYVGDILGDMVATVKELDVDSLSGGQSGLSKIPIVGKFVDAFNRFITRYEKISVNIERILTALERARMDLLKDITVLDKMYELNLDYLEQLDLYIAAGETLLTDLRTKKLPELEVEARTSSDPMAAQRLADFDQALTRFERRLHDLKLTRMIAIQTAPQVRLIQNNDQGLVEKIQSSIMTTIPLWKNQIVIAISLYRQQ
ncbi:MAG: toxic anion resistance protein, partial [Armatimonadetes bacterium]|nr:toxic anion resistance protein [Armatimonadota bacterium]